MRAARRAMQALRSLSLLRSVVAIYGGIYLAIGSTWILTDAGTRFMIIAWIAGPYAEVIFGAGWIIVGLLAIVGSLLWRGHRAETVVSTAAFLYSLFVGIIFLLVSVVTPVHAAWIQAITYIGLALVVYRVATYPDVRRIVEDGG